MTSPAGEGMIRVPVTIPEDQLDNLTLIIAGLTRGGFTVISAIETVAVAARLDGVMVGEYATLMMRKRSLTLDDHEVQDRNTIQKQHVQLMALQQDISTMQRELATLRMRRILDLSDVGGPYEHPIQEALDKLAPTSQESCTELDQCITEVVTATIEKNAP